MDFEEIKTNVQEFVQNHQVAIASGLTTACGLLAFRKYAAGGACRSKIRMDNRTVLITGANTGIGKETAKDLAKRGARVLMACRDKTRAEQAAEEVKQYSGNQDVHIYILDLASLASVRKCAEEVKAKEKRLDVLINNAALESETAWVVRMKNEIRSFLENPIEYGIMRCPYWKTEDGFEMQFGTNHLGHFLFTNLLLDLLKSSAPSRIVNVSSLAHTRGQINFDDINSEQSYDTGKAYSQSKLANVLFTRELSKRLEGTNVTTNSLHPGVIMTELGRHMVFSWIKKMMLMPVILLIFKTPVQGAQTNIYCAVSEDLEGVTGKYFSDCAVKATAPQASDDEVAAKLWTLSEKMVGLTK